MQALSQLEQALQFSIERFQKHYPFLQTFIKEKNGQYWFELDLNERSVQLKVIERRDDNQWLELARLELNMGFDHSSPPLMRVIYLKSFFHFIMLLLTRFFYCHL